MRARLLPALLVAPLFLSTLVLADEPSRVTVSLDEFLQLYERSRTRAKDPERSPVEYTLSAVAWDGEVQADARGEPASAVFNARLRIDRHEADGWSSIPVLSGEAALIEAVLDGKPAPLVLDGGWYRLVTNRTGALDLRVRFAVGVSLEQGLASFSFPLPAAGSNTVSIAIPSPEPLEVTVAQARVSRDAWAGGKQIVEASVPPRDRLAVRWQRAERSSTTAQEQPRVYAEVMSLVDVADGLLRATTTIQHTILFAGVDTFRYDLPDGMTVLDVRGSGLREWTVAADGDLVVKLNYAAEAACAISVDLEKVIGEGDRSVDAPLIVPRGVERSKGWVGVTSGGNLEVSPGQVANATPVDVRTLPPGILGLTNQPVLMGYKYLGTGARLPLEVKQHDEVEVLVTLLDQAEATTMFTEDGRRLSRVVYQVRNNRRQYLRLALPEKAELWSAAVAGRAVQPARASDGAILMPLIRSSSAGGALSSFQVEVVYVESMDGPAANGRGSFRAQLPSADVPTTYVSWTVYAPSRAKVSRSSFEGSIRNVSYPSRPLGAIDTMVVQQSVDDMSNAAQVTADSGGLGTGAAPVRVELPLEGQPLFFEKLLALDEALWVSFDYSGLK
ncbi:MAG TPA: hypothetical protein PKA64_10740 [Myxococcota bacterium]|nr:hypothetical protein [Myxococcota bacterium]